MNMRRRFLSTLVSFALAFSALAIAPGTVAATGNCGAANVYLWSDFNGTGSFRKYCFGVSDMDMDTAPIANPYNMGPLNDGSYKKDFAVGNNLDSGIKSITLYDATGGDDANVCIYYMKEVLPAAIINVIGNVHTPGTYNVPPGGLLILDVTIGAFRWTSLDNGSDCL